MSIPVGRVTSAYLQMPWVNVPFSKKGAPPGHRRSHGGKEISMSPMKMGMAVAAACVAMASMTMIARRKRSTGKGRKR